MFLYKHRTFYTYTTILTALIKAETDNKYNEVNMKEFKINSGIEFPSLPMKIDTMIDSGYIKYNLRGNVRHYRTTDSGRKYSDENHGFLLLADHLNRMLDPPISTTKLYTYNPRRTFKTA